MSGLDNSDDNTLSTASFGVYSFHQRTHSRVFNSSLGDSGFDVDWHYNPVHNYASPRIRIAVVDD